MKCPKCGYLGFETTDRCRNCGYDFSLAAPLPEAELPLRPAPADLAMVDLTLRDDISDDDVRSDNAPPRLTLDEGATPEADDTLPDEPTGAEGAVAVEPVRGSSEELPLFAPRPAGPPLAVRRPGTEVPRAKRTTTRPLRVEAPSLPLVAESTPPAARRSTVTARAPRADVAGTARRLAAGLIDVVILGSIDALVLWLTLRIVGLDLTREDLAVIRPLPMAGFFLVLAFLYLVGFTIGGGQTVGKMALGLRVIGDDGQGVDLTGAVVRACGAIASTCTLGLLFVPVCFSPDRRAFYDRLAGTRVVVA